MKYLVRVTDGDDILRIVSEKYIKSPLPKVSSVFIVFCERRAWLGEEPQRLCGDGALHKLGQPPTVVPLRGAQGSSCAKDQGEAVKARAAVSHRGKEAPESCSCWGAAQPALGGCSRCWVGLGFCGSCSALIVGVLSWGCPPGGGLAIAPPRPAWEGVVPRAESSP